MARCLISLGANLGHPTETLLAAYRQLVEHFGADRLRMSRLYRSPPVGGPEGQSEFVNAVVAIETDLEPFAVWRRTCMIEQTLGRQRQQRWEARRIDIDILLHGAARIWTPHFKLPHPRMSWRRFVLQPACEVAADWLEPVSGWSLANLAAHLQARSRPRLLVVGEPAAGFEAVLEALRAEPWLSGPADEATQPAGRMSGTLEGTGPLADVDWLRLNDGSLAAGELGELQQRLVGYLVPPQLLVVVARTPDPLSVAWEDYSRPWAVWLGMTGGAVGLNRSLPVGPRYLLEGHDPAWAAHEIQAALEAMVCDLEPIDVPQPPSGN
jgi:2-amino-4-hydroxy-6-hydroxymethyldihydropteridine diphosphokinase